MTMTAPDLLATIVAATRRIVEARQEREPLAALAKRAESVSARPQAFFGAVSRPDRVNVIAECKRRSPSRNAGFELCDTDWVLPLSRRTVTT